jgi:hypothetical protein
MEKGAMSKFAIDDAVGQPTPATPHSPSGKESEEGSNGSGAVQASRAPTSPSAKEPQAAPVGSKKRAKKIEASEPKRQDGFSVGEDDWTQTIPKPGHYAATVAKASIDLKSRVTYLYIDYMFKDDAGRRFTVADYPLVLDAAPQDRLYSRSAQGKGRVKAIMEANARPLQFTSIQAVPLALIGCRVTIALGHRDVDGLPVPSVQGIVGPADPAEEPS